MTVPSAASPPIRSLSPRPAWDDGAPPGGALVVLDACVLMSGVVRPLLLRLAAAGRFRPVWSERIGQEWRRNAARIWQVEPALLDAQWQAMQEAFPQADCGEVDAWKADLRYSDPKDWHVIAAGRAARSRTPGAPACVLTWNLKDFNRTELRRLGLAVLDPDRLLAGWWPGHAALLRGALAGVEADALALGRTPAPLAAILQRERLYRLGKLLAA